MSDNKANVSPLTEFANYLKSTRVLMNVSIDEIRTKTRLDPKYIHAMENGEFDKLPGASCIKSYIKAYAGCIGLDPNYAISRFNECSAVFHRARKKARLRWLLSRVAIVAAGVLLLLAVFSLIGRRQAGTGRPATTRAPVPAEKFTRNRLDILAGQSVVIGIVDEKGTHIEQVLSPDQEVSFVFDEYIYLTIHDINHVEVDLNGFAITQALRKRAQRGILMRYKVSAPTKEDGR